jgi:hypothetical protein
VDHTQYMPEPLHPDFFLLTFAVMRLFSDLVQISSFLIWYSRIVSERSHHVCMWTLLKAWEVFIPFVCSENGESTCLLRYRGIH